MERKSLHPVRLCFVCLVLACVLQFPPIAMSMDDSGYPITAIHTVADYGQHNQNWDVLQGNDGLIYVANGNGLMAWDGERWDLYPTPNRTEIRAFTEWKDGRIYAGTTNDLGVYEPDESGRLVFRSLIADWPEEDRQFGVIWWTSSNSRWVVFAARFETFVFDGESMHRISEFGTSKGRIFDVDDRLLARDPEQKNLRELGEREDGTLEFRSIEVSPPMEGFPMAMYARGSGLDIVTATHGILTLENGQLTTRVAPEAFGDSVTIYSSHIAADGNHYVGTIKHGVYFFGPDGGPIRNYRQEIVGSDTILAIGEDDQGNIWLVGEPVITRMLPPKDYSRYIPEDGSTRAQQTFRHDGQVFMAGLGLYRMVDPTDALSPPQFDVYPETASNQHFDQVSLGQDLFLAMERGVIRVQFDDAWQETVREVVAPAAFAYDLHYREGGDYLFAATTDGLFRVRKGAEGWEAEVLPGTEAGASRMSIDDLGVLWAYMSDRRIARMPNVDEWNADHLQFFGSEDGIGQRYVTLYLVDGEALFASEFGLLDYQPDRKPVFQPSTTYQALFEAASVKNTEVSSFHKDENGRLWVSSGDTRFVAQQDDGGQWSIARDVFSFLPDALVLHVYAYSDATTWVTLDNHGVHSVGNSVFDKSLAVPPLHIREVSNIDTGALYYSGYGKASLPELDQHTNSVRFHFALADFRTPMVGSHLSNSEYRTRLLGSGGNAWSEWGREARKDYTLLGGGDYRFEVQARTRSGIVGDAVGMRFTVRPHWYWSQAAMIVYILAAGTLLLAAIGLGSRWRRQRMLAREQELEELVDERTTQLAAANRALETLANSDGLTGLANRRFFDAYLEERVTGAVCLVLIDIDHFKQYNDTHGHIAGDDLLRSMGEILAKPPTSSAFLSARYGGEEFALVLEDSLDAAKEVADTLRAEIRGDLGVTASMGLATRRLESADDIPKLIEEADQALYRAKELGRNRLIVASRSLSTDAHER